MKKLIEDFWIRCYLGSNESHKMEELVINRAYRDLNRTIHGMKNIQLDISKLHYIKISKKLLESINILMNLEIKNQQEYDELHEKECKKLIQSFDELYKQYNVRLHIGQAQKWINMSIKYFFALGENRHSFQLKNFKYFHIPIDNLIQIELEKNGIEPLKTKWSRIEDYSEYLTYQKKVRKSHPKRIPLELEFELFNS
ncbi:MAG: hypothetical protein FJX80_04340 [Bacteroidetes bacterium]|nr:hypothetical protein [Bacteroidota bacterium]